ncbi:acyltransferase [Mycobacterium hodleri]|uniref:acyltransferase family protein n=1 Tax=Mycolicibacterium hodleri TaxID=49897 RepID=UPI0021F342D2|nr:acyltransferase [Mycolicibacterium hodleri]MCV7137529.1 acyltransferase [Mycolicibacterium hodleri]
MSQDVTSATPTSGSPEPASTRPRRARIIGLDGVRGLLCLSIAVTHITGHYSPKTAATWQTNVFGFSLVYFFVLSGFLLSLPFVRNLIKDRAAATLPNVTDYTVHRLARIMPAYVLIFLFVNFVLQVSYVANPALQPLGTDDGTGMITDPGMLIANLTLTQSYFPAYIQTGINPSWSLTLEYAFYASLPVLFLVVFRLRKRLSVNPLVLATAVPAFLLVLGLVGRAFIPVVFAHSGTTDLMLLNWGPNWAAVFTKSFLTNADNFALGMLAAIVFVAMERGELPERLSRRVRMLSTVAILPVLLGCGVLLVFASEFVTAGVGIVAALMILIIVAPLARHQKSRLATALDFRPIRFVGEISLSAYLWHFPVLLMLGRIGWMSGDTLPGMLLNIVLALAVTILAGSVTYYLIEKPAMNYAKRIRAKKKPALA